MPVKTQREVPYTKMNVIILGILVLSGLLRRTILTVQAVNEEEQFEEIWG